MENKFSSLEPWTTFVNLLMSEEKTACTHSARVTENWKKVKVEMRDISLFLSLSEYSLIVLLVHSFARLHFSGHMLCSLAWVMEEVIFSFTCKPEVSLEKLNWISSRNTENTKLQRPICYRCLKGRPCLFKVSYRNGMFWPSIKTRFLTFPIYVEFMIIILLKH
jgi:hypothetical protein